MTKEHLRMIVQDRLKEMDTALSVISDETAVDVTVLFQEWKPGQDYELGYRLRYGDKLYRVVQPHTSQEGWEPDKVPALFAEIAKPGEIPEWKQPTGAQDAYAKGDKVRHSGKVWESEYDSNVWEPGVFGWTEVI